jgi:hypothetical protein
VGAKYEVEAKPSDPALREPGLNTLPQCVNCPYGKQTRAPFQKVEKLPSEIGDVVASDLCCPFEPSIGNYRYFVTWIELKTCLASIDFLKNKECATVAKSFKLYLAWLLHQKNANVK